MASDVHLTPPVCLALYGTYYFDEHWRDILTFSDYFPFILESNSADVPVDASADVYVFLSNVFLFYFYCSILKNKVQRIAIKCIRL